MWSPIRGGANIQQRLSLFRPPWMQRGVFEPFGGRPAVAAFWLGQETCQNLSGDGRDPARLATKGIGDW
jgi:hypothetical protein